MLGNIYSWTRNDLVEATVTGIDESSFVLVSQNTATTTNIQKRYSEHSAISRNDTNAAGTVTAAVIDDYGHVVTNL